MASAGAVAPEAAAPIVIWNENPLTGNFNLGTVAGQKIFLENTKGLATVVQLPSNKWPVYQTCSRLYSKSETTASHS